MMKAEDLLKLPNVLLIASSSAILLALGLAGGSLSKSVKWNLYKSGTDFNGGPGSQIWNIYAYQTLWTSYDAFKGNSDQINTQAYDKIKKDSWRLLARILVSTAIGAGGLSLTVLTTTSLIPMLNQNKLVLQSGRIASSVLSLGAGATLAYALHYYKSNYPQLLAPAYYDPNSFYPDEDNVSTGFYMSGTACGLLIISATINVVNVVLSFLKSRSNIAPLPETKKEETS